MHCETEPLQCWRYRVADKSWHRTAANDPDVFGEGSAAASSPELGLAISGLGPKGHPVGKDPDRTRIVLVNDRESLTYLPPLPESKWGHCIVALPNGGVIVTGGNTASTFLFYTGKREWERLVDLPTPRADPMCGLMTPKGHEEDELESEMRLVVAGGWISGDDGSRRAANVSEHFGLISLRWKEGGYSKRLYKQEEMAL